MAVRSSSLSDPGHAVRTVNQSARVYESKVRQDPVNNPRVFNGQLSLGVPDFLSASEVTLDLNDSGLNGSVGWMELSEIVKDLVRQMLRLHFDDETIVYHLKSANIRNPKKVLDSVLNEAKQEAIARLDMYVY